jgi:hypothetical protein
MWLVGVPINFLLSVVLQLLNREVSEIFIHLNLVLVLLDTKMSTANANQVIRTTRDQGVELHTGLTLLLRPGNTPSQAKRIALIFNDPRNGRRVIFDASNGRFWCTSTIGSSKYQCMVGDAGHGDWRARRCAPAG